MTLSDLGPADRHRGIAATFTDRVRSAQDWDAPAPVSGWTARDVVRHLVEWLPALLAGGSDVHLPATPAVDEDPVAAWEAHCEAVQAVLDDPSSAERTLSNPHIGEVPVDQAIDRFYTTDVFLHTWDLARATGQDDRLDPDFCAALLAGMEPLDEMLRASGQYGPRVPVPADADACTRLIGFIGRDPFWTGGHPSPVAS
ncbi:TIGR03086 family metal-binding protein [Actinoplanes sp. NPDC049316]|uniref:TIGR03086 family metal-binding protein n=1 Tax=Actinoplanes sp. NPDC049316 TaxID=3154727 RepID=UPI0034135B24